MSVKKELALRHLDQVFKLLSEDGPEDGFTHEDLAEIIVELMGDEAIWFMVDVLSAVKDLYE